MKLPVIFVLTLLGWSLPVLGEDFFELPPIRYSETASKDRVALLAREIERGAWPKMPSDGKSFLKAVLEKLEVPEESQVLVFSKTSLQNRYINQRNPRALYYSNDTYVGWVPGGKIEIISEDETLGPVFYVLEPPRADKPAKLIRATDTCLQCHATSRTEGVPGVFIRSVVPDENSHPILSAGTSLVTDETPLEDRWGGWYVTGTADAGHLGNRWIHDTPRERVEFPPEKSDLETLEEKIDTSKYLQPTSDIVSLMVLEHQCKIHNLLTKAKLTYRRARHFQKAFRDDSDLDSPEGMSARVAETSALEIVPALLFADEVDPGGDGVEGGEAFLNAFAAKAVRNDHDRSLRDFRLYGRIFKYRCSYMIHSKAFKGLPQVVKDRVFHHLRAALDEDSESTLGEHIGSTEKRRIRKLLEEIVDDF